MTAVGVERVTYTFPRRREPALKDMSVAVAEGELCLLAGPSGGGKSTFLRLVNGLVPQFHGGTISGAVRTFGLDPAEVAPRQMALTAGMVFQEPEAQSIAETVLEEVAFGLEQRGVARAEMHRRVDAVLDALAIEHLRFRRIATLSGGERQRVAIAAVLALEPRVLLLDEPTSQLDIDGADALVSALAGLRRRRELTILIAEHRLDRLLPMVDRVLAVEGGSLRACSPLEAAALLDGVPAVTELSKRLGREPWLTVTAAAAGLPAGVRVTPAAPPAPPSDELLLDLQGATVAYGEHVALRDASFSVRRGELVALIGPNGSGKSTLFRAITGLSKLAAGAISIGGRDVSRMGPRERTAFAGLVPQDPALALYRETVREEVAETVHLRGRGGRGDAGVADVLDRWRVGEFAERNPRDISVGQQQRVAIAAMLAHGPDVWLMDEPTRGSDAAARREMAARLKAHAANGGAAIVATHDVEAAAHFATRVITLREGRVQSDLPARAAFSAGGPHPTQVARVVPGATTAEEVALDA